MIVIAITITFTETFFVLDSTFIYIHSFNLYTNDMTGTVYFIFLTVEKNESWRNLIVYSKKLVSWQQEGASGFKLNSRAFAI